MLEELTAEYGNVFTLQLPRMPGAFVFFVEPAAIRDLWTGDPLKLNAGEANLILRAILGRNSLILLDGQRHLDERRMLLPPFHGERMKAYGDVMRDAALRECERWPVGREFRVHDAMQAITLDVIMRTIFGVAEGAELEELREALVRWTTLGTSRLGTAFLLLTPTNRVESVMAASTKGLGKLLPWAKIVRAQQDVDRLVRATIAARRRAGTTGREDVLSMLLEARDDKGVGLTDDQLRDEMLTLLVAGHETTATTLAWTLHHLLENPRWMREVKEEAARGGTEVLDAAIKETLRLTPIIPIVGRRLVEPMTVGGVELPAGAFAIAPIYLVHRRADLWPDPTRFDPGRFIGKRVDPSTYFPFGGGARRCLGMAFATYEMRIVLQAILSRVELAAGTNHKVKLVRRGITFAPSGGMPVVVRKRLTAAPPA